MLIPGGSSVPCVPGTICDELTMDFDTLQKAQSGLGTAAVIVMDKSTDIIAAIRRLSYFYKHESCGQCSPCREGTGWLYRLIQGIEAGEGKMEDLDTLDRVARQIEGHTICAFGEAAAWPVMSFLKHFRDEFVYHIEHKKCQVSA